MGGNVAMIMRDMTENYKKSTFLCAEALIKKPMRIYSASAFTVLQTFLHRSLSFIISRRCYPGKLFRDRRGAKAP